MSRADALIEELDLDIQSRHSGGINGRLRFYDGSLLQFDETVLLRGRQIIKLQYTYHYQTKANKLIFRYDNAPHHPHIVTYPHHKHVGPNIESALPPDFNDVLSEIDKIIYARD
jgi:hypothetical protein